MGASVIPVIAIDGPSASGKGTIAAAVAQHLGFHYLDSGALYRIVGLVAGERRANLDSDSEISHIALNLNIKFNGEVVWVDGRDVSSLIRGEVAGAAASRVAALPGVRTALMTLQRSFRQAPGLVADRDHRDSNRAAAPLLKCAEAIEFDTTGIVVDAVVAKVLQWYQEHQKEH